MQKTVVDCSTQQQAVVDLTAEEQQARETRIQNEVPVKRMQALRQERNRLLAETDYLALADATLTDEMRAYRQALRDLPANTADPANPVWPEKPAS